MKEYLSVALALICAAFAVSLVIIKRGDNVQHESDAGAIADFSNQLDSARTQIAICNGTILTLSNNLDKCMPVILTFSNQMVEAQSTIALDAEQITNLNQGIVEAESENQMLGQRIMDLTNQSAGLTKQIVLTATDLEQEKKDYALLENRLRRDVAERLVVERKFYNPSELQSQMQQLKMNPAKTISIESIYADLDVEVNSNGTFHVVAPN